MIKLPEDITIAENPKTRDLVIIAQPKMGKSTILAEFTKDHNACIFNLEKEGYEFLSARKIDIYPSNETSLVEAYNNYCDYRDELLKNKGKYEYLLIDVLSELDVLAEYGGTLYYMFKTITGKNFNRDKSSGATFKYGDPDFKMVTSLADGNGYQYTRKWFLDQIEIFKQISPYRIYAAHIADKYIKDNGKEEVIGSEIALTGKLKTIFASKVTALAKLTADGDKRYLNFEVLNDSIIAGSRNHKLTGKILISEKENDKIITHWNKIYE